MEQYVSPILTFLKKQTMIETKFAMSASKILVLFAKVLISIYFDW